MLQIFPLVHALLRKAMQRLFYFRDGVNSRIHVKNKDIYICNG